jgi:fibronectin-binding autotransporter adhesin
MLPRLSSAQAIGSSKFRSERIFLVQTVCIGYFPISKSIGWVSFRERGGGQLKKQRAFVGAAIAAAISAIPYNAFAVDNVWVGTTPDWNTPTNWSLGRVPTNANGAPTGDTFDDAVINSTTLFPIITADLAATPRDIITGQGAGNAGRVDQTAGTATTGNGNWFYVGRDAGTGTYNLADTSTTGGTLTHFGTGSGSINAGGTAGTDGRVYVGGTEFGAVGATGTLNINTTGTVNVRNDLAIGTDGSTGVINMDAGNVTTGGWNFIGKGANNPGGNGTLNMSGGTITNGGGRTYIGYGNTATNTSTGKLVMSGGTYNNPGDYFSVGDNNLTSTAAIPSISMTGGTLNTSLLTIGGNPDRGGKGTVTVNGDGAVLNTGEFWIGQNTGSTGVFTLNAGTVNASNWYVVGRSGGTGTLNMNGGTLTKSGGASGGNFIVGSLGGTGTVNQTGGAINTINGGDTLLGENASTALWDISGGSLTTNALLISWNGGVNEFRVRGTGAVTADHIELGEGSNNGSGIVNQSGGTVTANRWLAVGLGSTQQAKYNLSGGTVNAGGIEAGADGPGLIAISGNGVLNVAGNAEVPTRNGAGTLSVSGNGVLNASNILLGGRDNTTVGNVFGSGVVNQSGGLVKVNGDVVVQRPNVGTGAYNLSGGTLSIDGALNTTLGTFSFTGGRLTRSTGGAINVAGDLHIGNKAAGFKLDTDKTFAVSDLFAITPGVTFDVTGQIIPTHTGPGFETGSFNLGMDNSILGTFDPTTTSVLGLTNLPNATFISETAGESHAYPDSQSVYWVQESGGQVSLQYSVTAPEPGTLGVLTLSGLTLLARRRKRR